MKHIRRLSFIITAVLMAFTLCACSDGPEIADSAAYQDLPTMEGMKTKVSHSSAGNKYGNVEITIDWNSDMDEYATTTDEFYLEYTWFDDQNYQPVVVANESDRLNNETITLRPGEKQTFKVDIDPYYEFYNEGFYRVVKVFDVKSYNGKTRQCAAYFEIGGNEPGADD